MLAISMWGRGITKFKCLRTLTALVKYNSNFFCFKAKNTLWKNRVVELYIKYLIHTLQHVQNPPTVRSILKNKHIHIYMNNEYYINTSYLQNFWDSEKGFVTSKLWPGIHSYWVIKAARLTFFYLYVNHQFVQISLFNYLFRIY